MEQGGACRRSAPFRCAKPRWPVTGPTGAAILPSPSRLRRAGAPTAKTRRLSGFIRPPFRLRRNRAGRSSAPPGPLFCRSRHGCAAPGPQRQNPGACRRSAPFRLRETARPDVSPAGGNVLAAPFSLCSNVAPHIPAGSAGVRSFVPRLAPRSHPGAQLRFILKQLYASGCPFLRNFPFFSSVPTLFLHRLRGAPIHKNPRRGYPAADLTPFQFPGSIFPSPTPEAVRPPPRRHIFWGFCIAINNFFFPSLIGVVIQLLLRTLPRMPKKESAPAFLFCFAPKGSFLPVLHSLFSLPLSFQMSQG